MCECHAHLLEMLLNRLVFGGWSQWPALKKHAGNALDFRR